MSHPYFSETLSKLHQQDLLTEAQMSRLARSQNGDSQISGKRTRLNRKSVLAFLLAILIAGLTIVPSLAQAHPGDASSAACEFLSAEIYPLRGVYLTPGGPWVVRMANGRFLGYEGGLMALRDC